ncbi:uncharacterized protein LOC126810703 [Patella vulgata]|uniref:uncharacterized protein LOC126810703 n=1 Tax=Patella vulgata TaxID=6465 RepID=UPI00217F2AFF|nr:uncharacterized protein LOC126810703 [Patella vulgata]XP_050391859.1 uncharacterized protein LOC126810703 [Patella vulgata]XP_050391860.1 uncharacterized protein LOC126810703 [Patella vulgata]
MEKKKTKSKKLSKTDAALGEMESGTIDPETFSFSMPTSGQRSTPTVAANSKLLALSLYVLNTTDDFKELSYRITKNTVQEESLVITHGGNLGLLGENLDPVTVTLTEKGIATINVLFRPSEKYSLLDKTLFDAGQFISILRKLTTKGQYLFCPGLGDVQPACFIKKLAYHAHPFSRYQSTDCSVWYKNTDTSINELLVTCKACKDLSKFIQNLPQKKGQESPEKDTEEEEIPEVTPKKRGRKKSKESVAKTKDELNSNTNNSCTEANLSVDKMTEDVKSNFESPKKSLKSDVSQSPRSSRRISARGSSFCKICMCFHNEKDIKTYPCQMTTQVALSEMTNLDIDNGNLSPSKKEKSSKGRRKVKTPVKRISTEEKPISDEEEVVQDSEETPLMLEVTEIKTEMEIGAEEELEFVLKADVDEAESQVVKIEGIEEEPEVSTPKSATKRKRQRRGRGCKRRSNQEFGEGSDQMDDVDAGASALLALTRGRKRDAAAAAAAAANETPSKKPGRPRVLGNQHSAPSGIEALLTAAMTADKDDKKGNKKMDNHLPTPRSKRDELNTPFKVLMAQIESDKAKGVDGSKPWKCPECGDFYSSKGNLRRHLRIHDLDRPHFCPVCNKTFVQKITLKVHMRLHSGDKPHVCSVCNRAFAQKSNMETHLRRHLGQRPYKCHLCNKGFSDKGSLGEHIKTHTGEQPYVCPICKKAFSQRANMRTHMRRHKDDRPYVCSECNKMFKNKDGFWKHITAVHKASTPKAEIPNLQDLEMFRKGLGDKEQDSSSDRDGEDAEETDTDDGEGSTEKKQKRSIPETDEEMKSGVVKVLPNGESGVKVLLEQASKEDAKKVVTQYVHSTEPVTVDNAKSSTPSNTITRTLLDADLTLHKKALPKLSPKPVSTASQRYFPVIVNTLNSKVGLQSTSVTPSSAAEAKPKPVAKTINFSTPIKVDPAINIVATMASPMQVISKPSTSSQVGQGPVQAINMKPITLTSTPPVTSGYISVNLVGSDGKPMGVQYVNPKDLGLTISVQKTSVTKFQVSSILADNKSIVTSTIVTDPFTGKAVTFTPKTTAEAHAPKACTTTATLKRVPIGKKSPVPVGQESLTSFVQSLPIQRTIPITKTNQSVNVSNIAPKTVYVAATTSPSPGTKTVLIDMAPKLSPGPIVSKPVIISGPSTVEGSKTINSPFKQNPKGVKTHLKSLVNATILKSVAEKCKASALSNQQSIVTTILKSPPLSNLITVKEEELSPQVVPPNVTSVVESQVASPNADSQVIVTLSNVDSQKASDNVAPSGTAVVTLSNVDSQVTPKGDRVVILSNIDSQAASNGDSIVTLSNVDSQTVSNAAPIVTVSNDGTQNETPSCIDTEAKTHASEIDDVTANMDEHDVDKSSVNVIIGEQDVDTSDGQPVPDGQKVENSAINEHQITASTIDEKVVIDGQEVSTSIINEHEVDTTIIHGHVVPNTVIDEQNIDTSVIHGLEGSTTIVDGEGVTEYVIEEAASDITAEEMT